MSAVETCECRTFAIGRCSQCDTPVCMHHSRLVGGRCLCLEHYNESRTPAAPAVADVADAEAADRPGRRTWGRRR